MTHTAKPPSSVPHTRQDLGGQRPGRHTGTGLTHSRTPTDAPPSSLLEPPGSSRKASEEARQACSHRGAGGRPGEPAGCQGATSPFPRPGGWGWGGKGAGCAGLPGGAVTPRGLQLASTGRIPVPSQEQLPESSLKPAVHSIHTLNLSVLSLLAALQHSGPLKHRTPRAGPSGLSSCTCPPRPTHPGILPTSLCCLCIWQLCPACQAPAHAVRAAWRLRLHLRLRVPGCLPSSAHGGEGLLLSAPHFGGVHNSAPSQPSPRACCPRASGAHGKSLVHSAPHLLKELRQQVNQAND